MLTINSGQLQVFAQIQYANFMARLTQRYGSALSAADPPLDSAGVAAFVDMCRSGGIKQEDSVALLVAIRAAAGAKFFLAPAIREILADPEIPGRLKAFQINHAWEGGNG